ncbi:MAG: thioredoxin family protein [Betaproteobacteria bacterium]|nr:thioredoxin family protein [Betaproteobacteria bacterium]
MLRLLRSFAFLALVAAGAASAADAPFDAARFDALNNAGKPVLVAIHADWCPTCKAQEPIVHELLNTPELRGVTALRVDFDSQKDAVRRFRAQYQSTLIVFKGGKEVGRSTGDTRKESIAALLKKAI